MALNSRTNLKLIDALCEGPIEGVVEKRKGVFLNETALSDTEANKKLIHAAFRNGGPDQPLFDESSLLSDAQTSIISVNQKIGDSYSETVNAKNKVTKRDYGEGQVLVDITDSEADFVQLVFTVSKLFCVAPEGLARGQLFFAKIRLEVSVQDANGNFHLVPIKGINSDNVNTIKGIASSAYQFKTQPIFLRNFAGKKNAPYRIRVKKVAFGNTDEEKDRAFEISFDDLVDLPKTEPLASKRADEVFLTSVIQGKQFKTNYPFTALAHLSIDSEEYGTLPARSYKVRGKKVKIPSNANPQPDGRLEFDNKPFDGSLKTNLFWTTCPVCCFYDILTNSRYGAGNFVNSSNLNWVDLIEISKYCNAEVDTPEGREARFAINTVISDKADAYSVLQDFASIFRGMLFWKSDNVQVAADHGNLDGSDLAPIHIFSNSNVVNGQFSYSGSSLKTRSTRVRVRYNDPSNFYKPNFVVIEDRTLIDKYGIQEKSIVAFGCSSKYQAQRMGQWLLQSEKLHEDTITFAVGLEGLNVLPGQIFEVADEMRSGSRYAGRIVGATRSFVDLDQTATLPSGTGNKLSVVMADGTIETRDIASVSGVRVTLSSDFTQAPPDDALFSIKNSNVTARKFRCLGVTEGEDGTYGITGVRHVDGIYTIVEDTASDLALPDPFLFDQQPIAPQDLKITFQQIDDGRNTTNRATISWSRGLATNVERFRIRYRIGDGGNFTTLFLSNTSVDVNSNLVPGKILFAELSAIGPGPTNAISQIATVQREIPAGGTSDDADGSPQIILPPDPEDVQIEAIGVDQVNLSWGATANGQNLESFTAVIKHSSKTDGSGTWSNSVQLREVEARTTSAILPLMNGEYLIKFQNQQRLRSFNAKSAVINIPDGVPRYDFQIVREDSSPGEFAGDKVNVFYSDLYDGLIFDGDAEFDTIASLDGFTDNIDTLFGTQFTSGEYFFNNVLDLGAKYAVHLKRHLIVRGLYFKDLIDDRVDLIDSWTDFDGDNPDNTNVELYFRKSDNGVTNAFFTYEDGDSIQFEDGNKIKQQTDLLFDEWIPLENNTYVGRAFQFKAVLSTTNVSQTPIIDELGVTLQLERRTENSKVLNSGFSTSGLDVVFEDAFYTDGDTKVAVGITGYDLASDDYFIVSEPTRTGFNIIFKQGPSVADRKFQYTAVGFGTALS